MLLKSSILPASDQIAPLPINSNFNFFVFLYWFSKSVISSSPLLDGLSLAAYFETFLSKNYKPVIAFFEIKFFGFSTILSILFL